MRSIFYAYYYASLSGVPSLTHHPWNDKKQLFLMASGDDVVIFASKRIVGKLKNSILSLTTRTRDFQVLGLGQCIKSVNIGHQTEFDFCSLTTHSPTGAIEDLLLFSDMGKVFGHKQWYSKRNQEIKRNPMPYLAARATQLRDMQASHLLESMIHAQMANLLDRTAH